MGVVSVILGNRYKIQRQNCVLKVQGRVLSVWPCYKYFVLVIWCFRWIESDTFKWPNRQQSSSRSGYPRLFPGRGDFSILIFWTICQKAMPLETEDLILVFGWLGVIYFLAGGWRWDGAKPCLGVAEISSNMSRGTQNEFRISSFCYWRKWRE